MAEQAKKATAAKRGRRTDGGQAKEAIQEAAWRLFAENGFDRTSVRQIALAAHVDPMLVTHYFKTKAGLFAAIMRPPVEPSEAIAFVLAEGPDHAGERMAAFILRTLESPDRRKWIVAMVRAATAEPEIAAVVRERFAETILIPLAEAIGSSDPEYRATLVMSQLIGLAMTRYIAAVEPMASRPADEVAADIAETFQRYLTGPLSAG
ncbi:MAG: TetR/AcrR family transcriptional regulator [Catenulispora sp.]|nr:TetR/AcrR family transcriptional regulator [Catenulispora sp.]